MIDAFVFVMTEIGTQARVAQELARISGVKEAVVVAGPYDVVARVTAAETDLLGKLIVTDIQAVDGVTRTMTCPIVNI